MKYFLFCILLLLFACGNRHFVEYCGTEQKEKCFEGYKNIWGQLNGSFIEYYANGQISIKGTYKKNSLDGDYYKYYKDGKIHYHVVYKTNRLWNVIEYYDEIGNNLDFGKFKDGNDTLVCYYSNGNMSQKGNYLNGYKDGKWDYYSNAGYSHSDYFEDGKKDKNSNINYVPPL